MIVTLTPVNEDGTLAEPSSYLIPDGEEVQGEPIEEEWRPDPEYAAGYASAAGYPE